MITTSLPPSVNPFPQELVIRIKLPGVASASAAELDVSRTDVSVLVPGKYRLVAPLRYPVNSDMVRVW